MILIPLLNGEAPVDIDEDELEDVDGEEETAWLVEGTVLGKWELQRVESCWLDISSEVMAVWMMLRAERMVTI